jgi:hypothetical protein
MKFRGQVIWDVDIEIADDLIKDVLATDHLREFHQLQIPADIAAVLAPTLVSGRNLDSIDGFVNRENGDAKILASTMHTDFRRAPKRARKR